MTKRILLFSFLLVLKQALACTCRNSDNLTSETAKKLAGAYYGKIISIHSDSAYFETYQLLVSETFLGEAKDTVTFVASSDVGMCGIRTEVGSEWLLTFEKSEEILRISICSRAYDFSELIDDRKRYRFKFKYGENKYARKALHFAKKDFRVLNSLH